MNLTTIAEISPPLNIRDGLFETSILGVNPANFTGKLLDRNSFR